MARSSPDRNSVARVSGECGLLLYPWPRCCQDGALLQEESLNYQVITTPTDIQLPAVVSLDTEYSELNIRRAELLSVVIGVSEEFSYIFRCFKDLQALLGTVSVVFTWNGVVDWYMLWKAGIQLDRNKIKDAMLMEHLVDERLDHGLGDYAKREFNDSYKMKFWDTYETYGVASDTDSYEYEAKDGCYTYHAGMKYSKLLESKQNLVGHVHRLQWALFDTEVQGIRVDVDLLKQTKSDTEVKIKSYLSRLRKRFHEYCTLWELQTWKKHIDTRTTDKGKALTSRPEFSFQSDSQIQWLVYDALEAPVIEKTPKGNPSTSLETLQTLSEDVEDLREVVEYKTVKSLYAVFMDGLLKRVEDGRIYPSFYINGTSTGRISHSNPNMGNLPKDGVIRNFFIPDEGGVVIGADYSQLEVVVEANLTEDAQLLKIILEGASKHDITAQGLGIPRDQAKTLNFALQYGAGEKKISKILGVSFETAKDIFRRYWELYSGVKILREKTFKELKETNQVTNLFGRIRHFPQPRNNFEEAKYQRQAYNHLIQGVGADITNMATYLVSDELKSRGLGRVWFSVHDELVCEIGSSHVFEAEEVLSRNMGVPNVYLKFKYPVKSKFYGPLPCWAKSG